MSDLKKRVIAGTLGLLLALSVAACDEADPSDTSSPGGSATTEPVGS